MKRLVVGNLKSSLVSRGDRNDYVREFVDLFGDDIVSRVDVVVCPPSVYLESFIDVLSSHVSLGAQQIFWDDHVSRTGAVSPPVLRDFGVSYVIVGHSEQRAFMHVTKEDIQKQFLLALSFGMVPILCIGESRDEHQQGRSGDVLTQQLLDVFSSLVLSSDVQFVVAYEPVWAVGTDDVPSAESVSIARRSIQRFLCSQFGDDCLDRVSILYGGSVDAGRVASLCGESGVDGVLVGRASWNPQSFFDLVRAVSEL
ncbi:MAG: triosephosphate isomerase [Candidatus Moranbacteria bacterium]|nr:triosephosphate isomerase [Candidatus Moranbacteria bacterium]